MIPAVEAFERLKSGNARFAADVRGNAVRIGEGRRRELLAGQEPFAIILGCSDSRVPAEIVFDQGLGDLFVIRVAGNVVAPSLVGSVEFAADQFGTRLVVVMGHSGCGAVAATIDAIGSPGVASPNVRSIVDRIRPAVQALVESRPADAAPGAAGRAGLMRHAVRANIRASADHLRHGSKILEDLAQSDGLLIVGAEYDLESGVVDFFDGAPG